MKTYLNQKTRIKLKYHLPALDNVLALQRKKWYGWKTTSWIYPSIMEDESLQAIIEWLEWHETREDKPEKDIGEQLMTKYKNKL